MAYDEELAERIRDLIGPRPDLVEQRMFGGLAFLIGGHMAIAASGRGGILVRTDPADAGRFLAEGAEPMEMRGRAMTGWLRVGADAVAADERLLVWVERGTAFAESLPAKTR